VVVRARLHKRTQPVALVPQEAVQYLAVVAEVLVALVMLVVHMAVAVQAVVGLRVLEPLAQMVLLLLRSSINESAYFS
jgi:hypothetical protein